MVCRTSFLHFMALVCSFSQSDAFNPSSKFNLSSNKVANDVLNAVTVDSSNADGSEAWTSLTQMVQSKIDEQGGDSLTEEAKDEIIATAVAGSVLGTVVGSPLVVGAALGYAGSHMLQGEKGEKARQVVGQASQEMIAQANSAINYAKQELENEKDLSQVSAKILLAIQDKAGELKNDIKESPTLMMERMKENVVATIEDQDFKTLPKRSFGALKAFLESEEVKNASLSALNAIKAGLESDEVKALQSRATKAVKDTIESSKV